MWILIYNWIFQKILLNIYRWVPELIKNLAVIVNVNVNVNPAAPPTKKGRCCVAVLLCVRLLAFFSSGTQLKWENALLDYNLHHCELGVRLLIFPKQFISIVSSTTRPVYGFNVITFYSVITNLSWERVTFPFYWLVFPRNCGFLHINVLNKICTCNIRGFDFWVTVNTHFFGKYGEGS